MFGRSLALGFYFACFLIAVNSASALAADKPNPKYVEPKFVKVYMSDRHVYLGQLVRETPTEVELTRLDGTNTTLAKSDIRTEKNSFRRNVGQQDAIEAVGLVDFLAWQFRRALPWAGGRITKIDGSTAEVSLGTKNGIKVGDELTVLKTTVERKPVTARLQRRSSLRNFELKVSEVTETTCKAKWIGNGEIPAADVGYEVMPQGATAKLALIKFTDEAGTAPQEAKLAQDSLCLGLFGRNHLQAAVNWYVYSPADKSSIQPWQAYDPSMAQQLGKQLGAFAILVGRVTPTKNGSDVALRLIKSDDGKILAQTTQQLTGERFVRGAPPTEELTAAQKEAGWKQLFNGKNLQDWGTLDGKYSPHNWNVFDGCLVHIYSGIDHAVYLKEQFENFELSLDWKSDGNSGVFVRASNLGDIVNTGLEIQIETTREKLPKYSAGALYSLIPSPVRMKEGQWNHYDIVCDGPKISCKLNGAETFKINLNDDYWQQPHGKFRTAFAKLPRRGYIILQDHRDPVAFKNVKIRPLPDSNP